MMDALVRSFSKEEDDPETEEKVAPSGGEEKTAEENVTLEEAPQRIPHERRQSHLSTMIRKNRASLAQNGGNLPLFLEDGNEEIEADLVEGEPEDKQQVLNDSADGAAAAGAGNEDKDEDVVNEAETDEEPTMTHSEQRRAQFKRIYQRYSVFQEKVPERLVEVRAKNYSYHIPVKMDAPTVKTVANQSICYATYEFFRRIHQYRQAKKDGIRRASIWRPHSAEDVLLPFEKKPILKDINLVLKPGRCYLVLGPPESGKTSLLKAIAGRLPDSRGLDGKPIKDKPHQVGRIEYNGVCALNDDPDIVKPNVVSYVGQLDNHAPYLTVKETFEFAFQSRTGGKHESLGVNSVHMAAEMDQTNFTENLTIEGLDLKVCENTFVGNENVRGVSGGQRRRVTVGEMMQGQNPVACADEISTGLDAAVTYDIVHSIVAFAKAAMTTRVVSLLQPGPETFTLFDELILLCEGHIIYAGPIDEVVDYFEKLGYKQPSTMDVADFLQLIPTPDGAMLFHPENSPEKEHYSAQKFALAFVESEQYQRIATESEGPSRYSWVSKSGDEEDGGMKSGGVPKQFYVKFQNSFWRSTKLNLSRHFTLWIRDKGFIIGKTFENIGMAVATGGILFGAGRFGFDPKNPDPEKLEQIADEFAEVLAGIYGALFMTTFHILLGTMTSAPDEIDQRLIHYKHCDANFYQTGAFNIGRLVSSIPQRAIEIVSFGIPLYFMVGLDLSAGAFFTYLCLLICYTTCVKMMFSVLAQILPKKASVQGVGTFIVLLLTLFSGFIVYPDSIPAYYQWIYWLSPMAWTLQGLASNEFMSKKYSDFPDQGAVFLLSRGFKVGRQWIGYSFLYLIPCTLLWTSVLTYVLKFVRIEPEKQQVKKKTKVSIGTTNVRDDGNFNLPFIPVDLTFDKLVYEVIASTSNETLRLLNEVSGAFLAGRMVALMGSSGAGKTTLMDVIAMRKTSGTITGEIKLNGFPQERTSFLRCSGYVEQFDVQQPELTVRETVTFCARLRLDSKNPAIGSDEGKLKYVDHVLETMELTDIQTLQVGSYEEGGLAFEQRKRLAIACELAGSPSVLFLDEPTSGLDSRGALVVMRAMKRIADTGRTVCATIHQPSSAVFEMFDDLLLLKKGGNVVFFGELGEGSSKLIDYFESQGATPIEYGENPAAWMLRAYAGEQATEGVDYAEIYKSSEQFIALKNQIQSIGASPDEKKKIYFEGTFATEYRERAKLINNRILTIYKRSPAYNLTRLSIAVFYSFLIGSVFIRGSKQRRDGQWKENEVDGVLGTIFLSTIIIGVTSISMAVPVMKRIRDVFYKHRASGMIGHTSLSNALGLGETPYIIMVSLFFGVVYYFTVGLFGTFEKFAKFFIFFTLNIGTYSFFGQAFICLVADIPTSGALVGALIGYNIFFSGYIVKPKYFRGPFQLGLWTAPGRFTFEGIAMTQFEGIDAPVLASTGSPYFFYLGCLNRTAEELVEDPCTGTMESYVEFFFGGKFSIDNFYLDVFALVGYVILARLLTWFSLKKFNYVNT